VWEHSFGITIETIDNPGWSVTISLERTELESMPVEPVKTEANERDWVQCRVAERGMGRTSVDLRVTVVHQTFPTSSAYSEGGPKLSGDAVIVGEESRFTLRTRGSERKALWVLKKLLRLAG
jgi:hypothetical protein